MDRMNDTALLLLLHSLWKVAVSINRYGMWWTELYYHTYACM